MRIAVLALAICLGCGNKSKLDTDRGGGVDALWDVAPDGVEMAIVASPRAVGLGFRAIAAVRELVKHDDFAPARGQLDAFATAMFGSETATPADAGFDTNRGFAMFATGDAVIGIMPVGNRDKFMAMKKGERGSAEDKLEQNICRQIGANYVCATKPEMFERLGKGQMRGKTQSMLGARGDAELYLKNVPLLGDAAGDLIVAAQIDPGQVSVHGRWLGTPAPPLDTLIGISVAKPHTDGASGFAALNLSPFAAGAPPIELAGGVTFDQFGKSLAGPVSALIPAGSVDMQVFAPLADPKPAQTLIENCKEIDKFFELSPQQQPGACRFKLEGLNRLELDAWVEGNTLRLGAKKGPAPAGKPGALTAVGRELGNGTWSAALWGRGSMLKLFGPAAAQQDVPPEVAASLHAIGLINELGAAARVEKDGVRFRVFVRTAYANPPALADKLVAFAGKDIISGKATEPASALAAANKGSPFAADFEAGQGGLIVPSAMIGLVAAVVMPAVMRALAGGGEEDSGLPPGVDTPMNQSDLMKLLLSAYVEEAYPKWKAANPTKKCPASLEELAKQLGEDPEVPITTDPWGHALVMKCDDGGVKILSVGPDGKEGTDDDVRSW